MRVPDFFVIGAQKAGTSTLHDWLETQADLCLPAMKETHFFSSKKRFIQGEEWYSNQFEDMMKEKIVGEVDPDYLFMPEVVEKMQQFFRECKFIVVLREPVKRAYSHYLMTCSRGFEKLNFHDALEAEKERLSKGDYASLSHFSYLSRSLYSSQILKFKQAFPLSEFYFSKFDTLYSKDTQEKEFLSICRFIGFEPDMSLIDFERAANVAYTPRSKLLRNIIYDEKSLARNILRPLVRLLSTRAIRIRIEQLVDKLNRRKIIKEKKERGSLDIPPWVRDKVESDLDELEVITQLDFSSWRALELNCVEKK